MKGGLPKSNECQNLKRCCNNDDKSRHNRRVNFLLVSDCCIEILINDDVTSSTIGCSQKASCELRMQLVHSEK